jgi:putative phosphoesterase
MRAACDNQPPAESERRRFAAAVASFGGEEAMPNTSLASIAFEGTEIAVLADCHIHEGGPQFPPALFDKLAGVVLIVTLGDMGEASGLDQLAAIAPVVGVRGQDDSDDPRTNARLLVLKSGRYDIGCVFDAKTAGLASSSNPFVTAQHGAEASKQLFGAHVDILLHAGTHRPDEAQFGPRGSALNPGSAVLPAEGSKPSFLLLKVTPEGCFGRIIELD